MSEATVYEEVTLRVPRGANEAPAAARDWQGLLDATEPVRVVLRTDRDRVEALIGDEEPERLSRFAWKLEGTVYKEGSSSPLREEVQEGEITASEPAIALIKLASGFGPGTTPDNTPEWGFESDHELTITLTPLPESD
jgi:hypothetical protein